MGEPLRKRNGNIQAFRSTTRNAMKNSTHGTSQWCTTCKTRTSAVLVTIWDYVRRWKSATINVAQEEAWMKTWGLTLWRTFRIQCSTRWDSGCSIWGEGGQPFLGSPSVSLSYPSLVSLSLFSLSSLVSVSSHCPFYPLNLSLSLSLVIATDDGQ